MEHDAITATLDRFEQDDSGNALGVLVFDDSQQLILPLDRLPEGCREGSVVQIQIGIDETETFRRGQEIRDIQSRLFGEQSSGGSSSTEEKQ